MLRASLLAALLAGPLTLPQMPATTSAQPPARPPTAPGSQLPPLPVTEIDPGAAAATLDSPRRLSLTFVEPRPIEEVIRLLIADTPFSLAIDSDVSGAFRGEIHNLTLRESFATVLAPLGLDFSVEGTVIHVTKHRMTTRQFEIDALAVERSLRRTTGDAFGESSVGQGSAASLTSAVPPGDAFAGIDAGVKALLSDAGRVHVDRRAGLATVTDFPERLERVALYLETLQVRSSREVRLETQGCQGTLNDAPGIAGPAAAARLCGAPDAAPGGPSAHDG